MNSRAPLSSTKYKDKKIPHRLLTNTGFQKTQPVLSKWPSNKESKTLDLSGQRNQLRDHEAMVVLGVPDTHVREGNNAHVEATIGAHIDARNEEFAVGAMDQEEVPATFPTEPSPVLHCELDDLVRRRAELRTRPPETIEVLNKGAVRNLLVDSKLGFHRRQSRNIKTKALESKVDVTGEDIRCLHDGTLAVGRVEDDVLTLVQPPEVGC